ncbi:MULTISPECIES: helix-turn-helix domain-containing protein [Streptomyces]|uniref:Helix-turn-helix domain-containing protein n=1 Tax=Streptomyces glycanivorans TaxID=3033808 RepID=A0ABY9J9Z0_9ACTN|nr:MULTISPECIES: helix-turn-helix domain-containing protein [unclassified Streptomyces]WSQ77992.1 helix-turn-helix domain-containing protein [Streptomyces sp. NBC_01213]WLQ64611.1 helix-turn-helix domain-containing protein [Streptomyces sp. Alt3]WSQ85365.1 helix-turn-helix domain-containing protein [Streptomyces sp. NBC_01212]WSR08543.1 helix-turn-helix domain-containing protein [Streptomyces sp. NBC_01208]WSR48708.1 helix-turn-helix domain-containing protein [Streptomyces sp. NBC_01201]
MTRSAGPAPTAPLPSPKERRRLREAKELSEQQVAAAVGVTAATVRAWETGRASPRGRRRAAYTRLIGCAEPRATQSRSVEADGSSTMSTAGTGTLPAPDTLTADGPAPATPPPDEPAPATPPPDEPGPDPQPRGLTAEEAYDDLYGRTAPGLTRQVFLLTGHRELSREAVQHAFRIAWQRWPEVATDRDPAGWVRAASYEYAMSPWHRLRRSHRRTDPLPEDPARRALLDALLGLPPSYRRTLLLHDGVGLGLPETAAETEASTHAAAGRLLNARAAVAELLPAPADPADPGTGPAPLHGPLAALALSEEVPAPPAAPAVRAGGERVAELWTRAALCFGVLLIGATAFTLHTAPTHYEQPLAPAERVGGVPPLGGPEKLTPQDLKLQKALKGELAHGPERLVPRIP